MSRLTINRLISGGVIVNYHCVSRCGHCLYNCGPHREKDYLDAETAEKIFRTIKQLGCRSVHIGGGEPFLKPEKLLKVASAAQKAGVGIDYVETNSAWYTEPDSAVEMLEALRVEGVHTLLISISPFHNAYIPFSRVRGVIEACRQTSVQAIPWVNAFVRDISRLGEQKPHTMKEYSGIFGADYLKRIPDRYWIHLGGRALETFREVLPLHSAEDILSNSPAYCAGALADTTHFHIDFSGNYIPGLCSGLAMDMADLGQPLDAGRYPLLSLLAESGISGLYDAARKKFDYTPNREGYLNHCDLCTDIRKYLISANRDGFIELAPKGFYPDKRSAVCFQTSAGDGQ